jgi:hypothetical protein
MNHRILKLSILFLLVGFLTGCGNKIKLTAPTNIRVVDQTLRWDASFFDVVPDFEVTINDSETKKTTYNPLTFGGSLSLNFITQSGEYNFKLKTITNNSVTDLVYESSDIVEVSYVFTVLSSVSFISYSAQNQRLDWNQVSGATAYEIIIDGTTYLTTQNMYSLPVKEVGGYTVRIKAIGNGALVFNSLPSSTSSFNFLPKVTNIQRDGLTISWTSVEFASSYYIYNDLTQIGEATNTMYTLPSFLTGNLSITVKAIGNNTNYFDSLMSDPLQFTII